MGQAGKIRYSFERVERKYFLTPQQQTALLSSVGERLVPDAYGRYTVTNLYYDTADWALIRASLEKPVYKEKLRARCYGVPRDGDSVFLELKKKFDGVVYKRRISLPAANVAPFLAAPAGWRRACSSPMTARPSPGGRTMRCGSRSIPGCATARRRSICAGAMRGSRSCRPAPRMPGRS